MRPIGVGLLSTIIDKVSCDSPTYSSEYFLLMYIILQIDLCIIVHNIVTSVGPFLNFLFPFGIWQ